MLHNDHILNNWPRIKTQVLSKWNKLSESDIEKTHGNPTSIHQLVNSKYGNTPDFDKTYEKICDSCTPSSRNIAKNDIENRPLTAPASEAGFHVSGTVKTDKTIEDSFHAGSPEGESSEANDELSRYSPDSPSHTDFITLDNGNNNTQFTAPDEFTPSQDPTPSREDITLGRNTSSATKLSTAQAESKSSDVSSYDATKKKP
ncbi:MAG: hypothetical protein K2Q18_13180 [Bdellovibrionales bacterium]|nr:hypothetical protein [Bdellovibrionales bacterium]